MNCNRETYSTKNLTHNDFICGLRFDMSLLSHLITLKQPKLKANEVFWLENGMSIDGAIRVKSYHELLGKTIINTENNKKYLIDCVAKHWYYGFYWTLTARNEENSHTTIDWININSISTLITNSIQKNNKKYKIIM